MARFIYRAEADGRPVCGIQDAGSAAEAIALLEARGLAGIHLQNHLLNAVMPLDTQGLSDTQYACTYQYFQQHFGWRAFFAMFFRRTWGLWLGCLGLGAWMAMNGDWLWMALVLAAPLGMLALGAWKFRDAQAFNALLADIARGEWLQAQARIHRLRRKIHDESVAMELDVQQACLLARQGDMAQARAVLDVWQPVMDLLMPGMFAAHLGRVFLAARDQQQVLTYYRQSMEQADGDAAMVLDCALMEARYGSPARAHCLLLDLDDATLPEQGYAFVPWVTGIIALRQGRNADAVDNLQQAVTGLQPLADNPAVWPSLAMMAGDLACSLLALERIEQADQAARPVWPVLSVHGDPDQLAALRRAIPDLP